MECRMANADRVYQKKRNNTGTEFKPVNLQNGMIWKSDIYPALHLPPLQTPSLTTHLGVGSKSAVKNNFWIVCDIESVSKLCSVLWNVIDDSAVDFQFSRVTSILIDINSLMTVDNVLSVHVVIVRQGIVLRTF